MKKMGKFNVFRFLSPLMIQLVQSVGLEAPQVT